MKTVLIILGIILVIGCYHYIMKKIDRDEAASRKRSIRDSELDSKPLQAVNDLYSGLTTKQKAAVLELMMALAGFGPGTPAFISKVNNLMKTASDYMQISASEYKRYKFSLGDLDGIVSTLKAINDRQVLDCLFLSFFSVVVESKSQQALSALLNIYSQFGYSEDDCFHIVQKAKAVSQSF